MNLKFQLKKKVMQYLMERSKKPFDAAEQDLQQLPSEAGPLINNSYYFGGNTLQGESLIMRIAFRNTGMIEIFVIYRTVEGRFLTIEKQEYPTEESPLKVTCTTPGKEWHLSFDGILRDEADGRMCPCTFEVDYTATLPPFSALHHSDFRGMAEAFAREKWNKDFFKTLTADTGVGADKKKFPQLHYEQTGRFEGILCLEGNETRISMTAARDHSFGKRDWNFMNAHIWLLAMTDQGEVMNFSIVNYPHVKRIFCGYSNIGEDRNYCLTDYNIISFDHQDGMGTDTMVVDCTFANGKTVRVTSRRTDNLLTPFDGGNFYFQEGVGTFDIGGVQARGSIEYGFNRDSSRWGTFQKD